MNFWIVAFLLLISYILQCCFGIMQIKDFNKAYTTLKKQGRVAIGRIKGIFRAGAIVMFAIDENGFILDGAYMMGVTIFAKFKEFSLLNGENIGELKENKFCNLAKPLRRAILDSSNNYNIIALGGEIPEKLSPFQKVNKMFHKKENQ